MTEENMALTQRVSTTTKDSSTRVRTTLNVKFPSARIPMIKSVYATLWRTHDNIYNLLPLYAKQEKGENYFTHTDLHAGNILVDPQDGTIRGIIDWECSATLPS